MNLTKENKKKLKHEKRVVFCVAISVLAITAVTNLVCILLNQLNLLLLLLIDLGVVFSCFLIVFLGNRKINKDLKAGIKIVKIEKIERKIHKIDYEAGSSVNGNMPMRPFPRYIFAINGFGYDVEKEVFDSFSEGESIEVHRSKYSGTLLEFKKIN